MSNLRQIPLTCSGHTRPVVHLDFNRDITECGYFLISACKGKWHILFSIQLFWLDWWDRKIVQPQRSNSFAHTHTHTRNLCGDVNENGSEWIMKRDTHEKYIVKYSCMCYHKITMRTHPRQCVLQHSQCRILFFFRSVFSRHHVFNAFFMHVSHREFAITGNESLTSVLLIRLLHIKLVPWPKK